MRAPESTIREAILFPNSEVRLTALTYFTRAMSQDETLMPLVIQAVEQYGRDTATEFLREADTLPQTEATIGWITGELSKEWYLDDVNIDNYCTALSLILCKAKPELLRPEMADLPAFPAELKPGFLERLEMATWDWSTGWVAFKELSREIDEQYGLPLQRHALRAERIMESLARHPEQGETVLTLLQGDTEGDDQATDPLVESMIAELAGQMRLVKAIPQLVANLDMDDIYLTESSLIALRWIGGDVVVEELRKQWPDAGFQYRDSLAEVLENIHTDLSVATCLEWHTSLGRQMHRHKDLRVTLAHSLLGNFADEGIEVAHRVLLETKPGMAEDLQAQLVAVAKIMGKPFPEYEEWHKEFTAESTERWRFSTRIREHFDESLNDDEDFDDEFNDEFDIEDIDEDFDNPLGEEEESDEDILAEGESPDDESDFGDGYEPPKPFRRAQPAVGRNDPCPCGSGKKYKKCCMGKTPDAPAIETRHFPVGTLALYGPDDVHTTKIVASVIPREGAEPILKRWVSSTVKDSPKVRREIQDFFQRYGVKSIAATESNMGCPHEEGIDFPEGGDCPFCPYWKGKQGSGRTE